MVLVFMAKRLVGNFFRDIHDVKIGVVKHDPFFSVNKESGYKN